ncbi:hypothetical protein FC764_15690 [Clostridium botulinum]|nr:hypothetical protein [Clostridium botulinum]
MCIKNYQNMLMEIQNKIINNQFKYKNTIIVGDNSSGKSEILKLLFKDNPNGYYFIDSVNRSFDYSKVSVLNDLEKGTYKSVVNTRINNEIKFNLEDSFDVYGDGLCSIEQIYFNYSEHVRQLFKYLLNIDFNIIIKDLPMGIKKPSVIVENERDKLSSGFQAIIRLLLEICYFEDSIEENINESVIVIDEINEFLSSKNEEKILPFLMKEFDKMNFIITTHSAEVIASSVDCNIIALKNDKYQWLDGNDFESVTDAREIFTQIYDKPYIEKTNDIEIVLRNLLNLKISNNWTEVEENKLRNIEEEKLSTAQKLLLNQIKSW